MTKKISSKSQLKCRNLSEEKMSQSLQLKMSMLRICAIEEIFCDFVRPKEDMLRLRATQKKVCCYPV